MSSLVPSDVEKSDAWVDRIDELTPVVTKMEGGGISPMNVFGILSKCKSDSLEYASGSLQLPSRCYIWKNGNDLIDLIKSLCARIGFHYSPGIEALIVDCSHFGSLTSRVSSEGALQKKFHTRKISVKCSNSHCSRAALYNIAACTSFFDSAFCSPECEIISNLRVWENILCPICCRSYKKPNMRNIEKRTGKMHICCGPKHFDDLHRFRKTENHCLAFRCQNTCGKVRDGSRNHFFCRMHAYQHGCVRMQLKCEHTGCMSTASRGWSNWNTYGYLGNFLCSYHGGVHDILTYISEEKLRFSAVCVHLKQLFRESKPIPFRICRSVSVTGLMSLIAHSQYPRCYEEMGKSWVCHKTHVEKMKQLRLFATAAEKHHSVFFVMKI
jgi:hypothetical protein